MKKLKKSWIGLVYLILACSLLLTACGGGGGSSSGSNSEPTKPTAEELEKDYSAVQTSFSKRLDEANFDETNALISYLPMTALSDALPGSTIKEIPVPEEGAALAFVKGDRTFWTVSFKEPEKFSYILEYHLKTGVKKKLFSAESLWNDYAKANTGLIKNEFAVDPVLLEGETLYFYVRPSMNMGTNRYLYRLNISTGKTTLIYDFPAEKDKGVGSEVFNLNLVPLDGVIYFNEFIPAPDGAQPDLMAYHVKENKVERFRENVYSPFLSDGKLCFQVPKEGRTLSYETADGEQLYLGSPTDGGKWAISGDTISASVGVPNGVWRAMAIRNDNIKMEYYQEFHEDADTIVAYGAGVNKASGFQPLLVSLEVRTFIDTGVTDGRFVGWNLNASDAKNLPVLLYDTKTETLLKLATLSGDAVGYQAYLQGGSVIITTSVVNYSDRNTGETSESIQKLYLLELPQ